MKKPFPLQFAVVGVVGKEKETLIENIERHGHSYNKNVTKNTDYLIAPANNTSKTKRDAQQKNNPVIITPADFYSRFYQKKRELESTSDESDESDKSDKSYEAQVVKTPKKQKTNPPVSIESLNIINPQKQSSLSNVSDIIDPSIIKAHLNNSLSIPFINREKESELLAELLLIQKSEEKGPLPILSQHFGSGKSTIVQNFREVLQRKKVELSSTIEGNVENLMKAALVRILVPHQVKVRDLSLFLLVTDTIINSLNRNNKIESSLKQKSIEFAKKYLSEHIPLIDFLIMWKINQLAPIIIFFDEMDLKDNEMIEFWSYFHIFFGTISPNEPNARNIYFITAGKSSALTKMGRGLIKSPIKSKHVILNMLEIKYIEELIERTTLTPTISIKTILQSCCGVKELEYFINILYEYTGGIPRLVVTVFESIVQYLKKGEKLDFSSRKLISKSFSQFKSNKLFENVRDLSEIKPFKLTNQASKKLQQLYQYAIIGLPICPDIDTLQIDLIYDLNIGVENLELDGETYLKLVVPKFIQLSGPTLPKRVTVLQTLFSQTFPISQISDKGALLEVLVRDSLISTIITIASTNNTNKKWCDVHECFANCSLLSDKSVIIDAPYVKYMPKIVTHKPKVLQDIDEIKEIQDPWKRELSDKNWPKIKTTFFDGNCIVHPAPKSRSSDLYFYLPPTSALAFAIKNYPGTNFTFETLQEEIDKAALSMQGKGLTEIALFVFVNGINKSNIHNYCTDNNCLKLTNGIFKVNNGIHQLCRNFTPNYSLLRNTPTNIENYSKYSKEGTIIHVPDGMEVIVLGEKAFDSFFSSQYKQFLDDLSKLDFRTTNYQQIIRQCYSIPFETLEESQTDVNCN